MTTKHPTTGDVETRIGRLRFEGGYPAAETVKKLYAELDFQRATQACLRALPLISTLGMQRGSEESVQRIDNKLILQGAQEGV